jgi:phosphonopyruvate decarboxylase
MIRSEVIETIFTEFVGPDAVVVTANGFIARESNNFEGSRRTFYMLGSMGLAAAIGLGISLGKPDVPVVVLDGDGNLLMGFAVLPMIGAWKPQQFLHVVLDNQMYESTGGQDTVSGSIPLAQVALSCGYCCSTTVSDLTGLREALSAYSNRTGPHFLHVLIQPGGRTSLPRIDEHPTQIADRVRSFLGTGRGEAGSDAPSSDDKNVSLERADTL